jgi:hypothetical protein
MIAQAAHSCPEPVSPSSQLVPRHSDDDGFVVATLAFSASTQVVTTSHRNPYVGLPVPRHRDDDGFVVATLVASCASTTTKVVTASHRNLYSGLPVSHDERKIDLVPYGRYRRQGPSKAITCLGYPLDTQVALVPQLIARCGESAPRAIQDVYNAGICNRPDVLHGYVHRQVGPAIAVKVQMQASRPGHATRGRAEPGGQGQQQSQAPFGMPYGQLLKRIQHDDDLIIPQP